MSAFDPGPPELELYEPRVVTTRRYRYHRRHTPHYYLVLLGFTLAALVCVLNTEAYATRSMQLATVCFAVIVAAALVISVTFFWGFYMAMSGKLRADRLRVMLPHAAVGTLSPLLYSLNISIALPGLGMQPVNALSVICSVACFGLLFVQFTMGRAVVRPEPLRVVRRKEVA